MSEKRRATKDASLSKRQRKSISLEVKLKVIDRFEKGEKLMEIARALNLNEATCRTIRSNAEKIKASCQSVTPLGATKVSRSRSFAMEKMEKLLSMWIEHQTQQNIPLSLQVIQTKALTLYEDVKKDSNESEGKPFHASHGWFEKFKKRSNLHNIKVTGEAAAADKEAAEMFPNILANVIVDGGYSPKQVINIDETGLYWKRMPSRTYISREERTAPGFKPARDRCTVLLGGNAEGDLKLKPLMVYHSQTLRALRGYSKDHLPVIWRANAKGWITSILFLEYFNIFLHKEMKEYCEKENLSFKVLLIIDNAPSHPHNIVDLSENIKVLFLPPNTTSLIQPMDQGVIASFKAYYLRRTFQKLIKDTDGEGKPTIKEFWRNFNIKNAIDIISEAWGDVTSSCMNGVWRNVWPECVHKIQGPQAAEDISNTTAMIVELAKEAGFDEVEEEDVTDLLNSLTEELTNEELMQLEAIQKDDLIVEAVEPTRLLSTKSLSKAFSLFEEGLAIFDENDSDRQRSANVAKSVNNSIACYREIYKEKMKFSKQLSMKHFIKQASSSSIAESEIPQLE